MYTGTQTGSDGQYHRRNDNRLGEHLHAEYSTLHRVSVYHRILRSRLHISNVYHYDGNRGTSIPIVRIPMCVRIWGMYARFFLEVIFTHAK